MNQFVLKLKWVLAAFAGLVLLAAYVFVASRPEDDSGQLAAAPAPAPAQMAQNTMSMTPPAATETVEDAQFDEDSSADDTLGDDAAGEDPTPFDDNGASDAGDSGYGNGGAGTQSGTVTADAGGAPGNF
ncbi:MAG: hypothetical protein P0Y56_11595 [Candidatus Andeanibacterium colombiense]|uniref:Uncharacterized protein n=1 Tax=Candidatus Andeanibacterium colombiense TaxID=3121345 RepID=A0AAJ6BN81_9SPHN|nr:MAG: hypothetical protein P0Y56_11595 [Sphingomonadaceae bacterium]